jgi:hypothetical protein
MSLAGPEQPAMAGLPCQWLRGNPAGPDPDVLTGMAIDWNT